MFLDLYLFLNYILQSQVIFFLDAYDELGQGVQMMNLWRSNNLDQFRSRSDNTGSLNIFVFLVFLALSFPALLSSSMHRFLHIFYIVPCNSINFIVSYLFRWLSIRAFPEGLNNESVWTVRLVQDQRGISLFLRAYRSAELSQRQRREGCGVPDGAKVP